MSRSGKVTVVGAGFYGSTTALRLAEYDIFETVVLTDIVEGKPEGLALDINQSRSIEGFETKLIGATTTADGKGYEATANSDVVVITAGLPRKPGMSRMDLIGVNAVIVRGVAENIAKHSPNAVLIVVSNPLDEMTALAQIASKFPHHRVMGQAGMLDTARFTHFVAEKLNIPVGLSAEPRCSRFNALRKQRKRLARNTISAAAFNTRDRMMKWDSSRPHSIPC